MTIEAGTLRAWEVHLTRKRTEIAVPDRRQRRALRCPYTRKLRYPSEQEARAALERIEARRAEGDVRRRERRAYPCVGGCGDWHLTSRPS